mgnify:CR=1 FL=1
MLVLRRKVGESLIVGDDIELVVLGVEGDRVKLGIQAPKDVEIVRKELLDAVTEENKRASTVKPSAELLQQLRRMGEGKKDV